MFQEEVTAIYLYTLSNSVLVGEQAESLFDTQWGIFNDRVSGARVGPVLHKPVVTNWAEYVNAEQQLENVIVTPAPLAYEEIPVKFGVEQANVSTNEGKDAEAEPSSVEEAVVESTENQEAIIFSSEEEFAVDNTNVESLLESEVPVAAFVIDTTPTAENLVVVDLETTAMSAEVIESSRYIILLKKNILNCT